MTIYPFLRNFILTSIAISFSPVGADTLQIALENACSNPLIKEALEKLKAARERKNQARAGYLPTLNVGGKLSRSDKNISGDQVDLARNNPAGFSAQASKQGVTAQEATIGIRQNLFQGGATKAALEKADADIKATYAAVKEAEQQVFLDTIKAYVGIFSAQKQVDFLQANVATKAETLKSAENKFQVGEESRTSYAQAQADYADSMARLSTAKAELEAIKATYERLTNKKPDVLTEITGPKNTPKTIQDAINKAVVSHPALTRCQFEETVARRQIDAAKAGQLPKIDFFAESARTEQRTSTRWQPAPLNPAEQIPHYKLNNTNNRIGIELNWVFYDGGLGRSQARENTHIALQKKVAIETMRRQLTEQIQSTWKTHEAAKMNIDFYSNQIQASSTALQGTQQELGLGSKTLLDVLNAQNRIAEAQVNLSKAEAQFYQSAYHLEALMGRLTSEHLNLKNAVKLLQEN